MLQKIVFLFIFFVSSSVKAQLPEQLYFKHLTPDNGLSQGVITNILVDQKGFTWMTSYDGINRFDGTHCISNSQIGPGIDGIAEMRGIVEDAKGDIWIGSLDALIQYSYTTNRFKKITFPDKPGTTDVKLFLYRPVAAYGHLLLVDGGHGASSNLYDTESGTWTRLFTPYGTAAEALLKQTLPPLVKGFTQHLISYVSNDSGEHFFRLLADRNGQYQWHVNTVKKNDRFHGSSIFFPVSDSTLLIASEEKAIWKYSFSNNQLEKIVQLNIKESISNLFVDRSQRLWIAVNTVGLFVYDLNGKYGIRQYQSQEANPVSMMGNQFTFVTVSKSNMLWLCNFGKGVDYCRLEENGFSHLFGKEEAINNKTSNFIRDMVEGADGNFYCNTQFGGVVQLDKDFKFIKTIVLGNSNSIGIDYSKTNLFFGNGELNKFNLLSHTNTKIREPLSKLGYDNSASDIFYHFSLLKNGNLLASTMYNVWEIDPQNNRISELPGLNDEGMMQSIFAHEDKNGRIYKYSVSHGLQVYTKQQGRYKPIFNFPEKFTTKYVYEENDTAAWIAGTNGLYLFDPQQLKIKKHYTVTDGLPNNVVYAISPDTMGRLWMSTNKGISLFTKATGIFKNYSGISGMQGNEYNSHTVLTTKDGRIVFGGLNGLTVIQPWMIKPQTEVPVIQITAMKADSSVNPFQFSEVDVWELAPGSNTVEFNFVAIDYINPQGCILKYRLTGYDKDWVQVANPGYARYVKLPAGNYVFEIMTANADGVWSTQVKRLHLYIRAWWWQQWWFKLLVVLVLVSVIMIAVRQYVKQKLYRQQMVLEKQLAVVKERERIITDLHDDVGATLSSMHIYGDLANDVWHEQPNESRKIIEKISSTSKELMGRMGDIIWSMKPAGEEKYSLETKLKNYSNELLSPKDIICHFEIDEKLSASIQNPELRKNILLIAKEAINNIAKYSAATDAVVSFRQQNNRIILNISDNGKGYDADKVHPGNGLGNIEQRCNQLGGDCNIRAIHGQGVNISCSFPIATISYTT